MSEITNKELAELVKTMGNMYFPSTDDLHKRSMLAAERLAQYPDMHHTEATNFRDLATKFLKMRDDRDRLQSIIDSMVDQRSKLHSRFKDRKGQANPEAEFMAQNDPVEPLAAMPDAGDQVKKLQEEKQELEDGLERMHKCFIDKCTEVDNLLSVKRAIDAYVGLQPQQPAPDKEIIKQAYKAGFMSACKWPAPVTQDADSQAFEKEFEAFWQQQSAEGGE